MNTTIVNGQQVTTLTRKELNQRYNFKPYQWTRKHDDILSYLNDFMEITEEKDQNTYIYTIVGELPEEIPPLPRKNDTAKKKAQYSEYVKNHLSKDEYKPETKSHMARGAIADFGKREFGHNNYRSVAERYTGPAMQEYGEKSGKRIWVYYDTYKPLEPEALAYWRECLKKNGFVSKRAMQNYIDIVVYKIWDEDKIEEDRMAFFTARDEFLAKYGSIPILASEWRLKMEYKKGIRYEKGRYFGKYGGELKISNN